MSHWTTTRGEGPLIATAIHNGHEMVPELAALSTLGEADRLREEDPHTGVIAAAIPTNVIVSVSRFSVDLNRPRRSAVYRSPADAWGLALWSSSPTDHEVEGSLEIYDRFHSHMAALIEEKIATHGRFVVYDVHSYNHRRSGPNGPFDDPAGNPTVNLGTGSLPERWRDVADAFLSSMAGNTLGPRPLDVRENVRFKGGHLSEWVHDRYGEHGCALAIEFKKVFMDEWSGDVDEGALATLRKALAATTEEVTAALVTA